MFSNWNKAVIQMKVHWNCHQSRVCSWFYLKCPSKLKWLKCRKVKERVGRHKLGDGQSEGVFHGTSLCKTPFLANNHHRRFHWEKKVPFPSCSFWFGLHSGAPLSVGDFKIPQHDALDIFRMWKFYFSDVYLYLYHLVVWISCLFLCLDLF